MATSNVAQFKGTLSTSTYPNKYNVVVPPEGPFFRTGLVLKKADGTKLIEGIDYYLGYYFKEAAEALKDQIYGGVMLASGITSVQYEIYSAGRDYRVPQTEIGKFLVKEDIKDPRNVDWSELMRYAPVIAAIDPPANLDEALLRDEVVKALDDIRKGIIEHAGDMDEAYEAVTDLIFANGKKIFDDNMYQHHAIKNAHQYTADEIGALKVLAKAVDATKAFGRTLDQLVDLMKANGIQQAHIDTLMPVVLGELRGRLRVLNNGALTFRTANSDHVIALQGEKFLITTTKPLNITADAGNTNKGLAVEIGSGLNTLHVASGAQGPIFNGAYLITPDVVSLYLSEVKLLPGNAYFQSTDQVKVFGNAKEPSPVNMSISLPTASETAAGLLLITNLSSSLFAGAAISQKAVNALKLTLDNYIDSSFTINGKKFVDDGKKQELTLVASDVGIGNMDNTSPADKPLTTAINKVLATKVKSDHTHVFGDLINVPTASDTTAGLLQLWDAIDATTNKVVTSKQGYNVQQRIDQYRKTVNGLLPDWTTGGAAYGNDGFLPIPTVSNYAGFGFFRASSLGAAGIDGDKVYVLRNGTDGPSDTDGVYYWYSKIASNGRMLNGIPTTQVYHPAGMSKFPGVTLKKVILAGDGCALFTGSDGKTYMVLYGGTMNYALHTQVYQVTLPNATRNGTVSVSAMDRISYCTMTLTDKSVVVALNYLTNNSFYIVAWKIVRSELEGKTALDFKIMNLSYPDKNGDAVQFVEDGDPENTNPATKRIAYRTQGGIDKWNGSNVVNYRPSFLSAAKGETIRLRSEAHGYYTTTVTGVWSDAWGCVYNIDADTGVVTLETKIFPLAITENKLEFPNGTPPTSVSGRNFGVAVICNFFAAAGYLIGIICDTYSNNPPYIEISSLAGDSYYDLVGGTKRLPTINNFTGKGAAGSLYVQYMRMAIHLGGDDRKVLFRYLNNNTFIVSKYTLDSKYFPEYPGYGPDNERVSVTADVAKAIARTPNVWKDGKLTLNGQTIDTAGTYSYKTVPGTTMFTSDTITVSDATMTSISNAVQSAVSLIQDPLTQEWQFALQVFDVGGTNLALVYCTVRTWADDTKLRAYNRTWIWKVPMSVDSGGNITLMTGSMSPVMENWYDNNASTNLGRDQYINSKLIYRDDGYVIMLGGVARHGVVGDSRWTSFLLTCDKSWANWTSELFRVNPSVGEQDIFLMPETGYLGITKWLYSGMYFGVALVKTTARGFRGGATEDTIIAGVKTAEGWELYVTEAERLRFGSNYYTLPEYNADIRDLFPGDYRNRTFYMHAVLNNGVPEYQLLAQQMPDTDTRLYIGTVVTDSNRITSSYFQKVKRYGDLKQLVEHASVPYRHDVDVASEISLSPMGLLRKEALGAVSGVGDQYLNMAAQSTVIGYQKRKSKKPAIVLSVADISIMDHDTSAFAITPKVDAVTSSESSNAAAAGAYWLGHNGTDAVSPLRWRAEVPVTPSKSKIRIRVWLPAYSAGGSQTVAARILGVTTSAGISNGAAAGGVLELAVTPNKLVNIELASSRNVASNQSGRVMAYAIYDFDGTNETLLTVSGVGSNLYVGEGRPDYSLLGNVLDAIEIPLGASTTDYWPVVTAGSVREAPPIVVKDTSVVVATQWSGLSGPCQASGISVNLMPRV